MTGVTTVFLESSCLWIEAWITKQLDSTVVIPCHQVSIIVSAITTAITTIATISGPVYRVDICAIRFRWPDSLYRPSQGAGPWRPRHISHLGGWFDLHSVCFFLPTVPEQQLVTTAITLKDLGVGGKVQVGDVAIMAPAYNQARIIERREEIDASVMWTHRQDLSVRTSFFLFY